MVPLGTPASVAPPAWSSAASAPTAPAPREARGFRRGVGMDGTHRAERMGNKENMGKHGETWGTWGNMGNK